MPQNIGTICLVIGAMKAGTTSLYHYLSQHPQVAPSSIKEPAFFADDAVWNRGVDWYMALWDPDPHQHRVALEASTDYTKRPFLPLVPERIATLPGVRVRFIYLMRHPLRRLESQARHAARVGAELAHMIEPTRDFSLDAGVSERGIMTSRYAYQLDAFTARFPAADVLPLVFEDMKAAPQATLDRVCDFLGLDRFEPAAFATHNSAADRKQPPPVWAQLARVPAARALAARVTSSAFRKRLRRRLGHEVPGRFQLTAEEEATVLNILGPDLGRLRDNYGIDPRRAWGIDPDGLDPARAPRGLRHLADQDLPGT
ncbi:Sulfotransferase domain-containing protein [Limimonas halophila]|uniref:Sulfotransferase domain-containing protein n=1 Tax=Limimonas halophila TaxID=1082479 RepID=A0A1G7PPR8_9PROT|nr:sulfotransferase [Limimonas halophila]SDF88258.1 Sulfotransferase domain-containing protein [Limimonas halophila]